jgi:hypothetical protein
MVPQDGAATTGRPEARVRLPVFRYLSLDKPRTEFGAKGCRKQFTVTVGTILEDSHIPLRKWLMVIHLMCASRKGMNQLPG